MVQNKGSRQRFKTQDLWVVISLLLVSDITPFLLRLPREMHSRIRDAASAAGMSMNEFCVQRISSPSSVDDAGQVIADAGAMFGPDLLGVIEYGSVARNEAAVDSDADLLLVLDRRVPLTRDLYRQWDSQARIAGQRAVDAHFTYVPNHRTTGGIWAEAAIDGRVLFERDRVVSTALRAIRNDIADGRLCRRTVHGQTYWTAA